MIRRPVILTLLLFMMFSWTAMGEMIIIELNYEFSGATSPTGPTPWLTAIFDDEGTPGSVILTLENTNLVNFEYTNAWYLNLAPLLNPAALSFAELSRVGTFDNPGIGASANNYKADGDGYYDILFDFSESFDGRFGAGESIVYLITGIPTLSAHSFNHQSTPSGGNGVYHSAAHISAIYSTFSTSIDNFGCPEGSGWIGDTDVSEPASIFLLALGGAAMLRRRQK
ncbi:MAG: PEP-CTERM sorting domain-containing protein [Planctomycetes bacterium]|nr:PEP-CTERM sorting domain-containing protein [Planctomycetota bacterium]